MNKICVYARPWNQDQFSYLTEQAWPGCDYFVLSEHHSVDASGFLELMKDSMHTPPVATLGEKACSDVIKRCRLLRSLPEREARQMVQAAFDALGQVFDRQQPTMIFSLTVDSYIMHLMVLLADRRAIPFIGLVPCFVRGYFRITSLGEYRALRDVGIEEVERADRLLCNTEYKPSYLVQDKFQLKRRALRTWIRNLPKPVYFRLLRALPKNRLNYHYHASEVVASKYWSAYPRSYKSVNLNQISSYLKRSAPSRPIIFLPLQMSPEATIDYWSSDTSWINYEERVLSLLREYDDQILFVIKEHPNLLGYRSPGFYRALAETRNCVMVAASVASNALFKLVDGVVISTGTVGFEAALRGVPVYSDSEPFHLPSSHLRPLSDLTVLTSGCDSPAKLNSIQRYALIERVLKNFLPGHFKNDGSWSRETSQDRSDAQEMAASLSRHYSC